MNMFALSFIAMLVLVLAEMAILKVVRKQAIPWKDVVFNLNSGHILMWVLRGVEVLLFGLVLRYASLHWVDQWPPLLQWSFAFIAWDLCFYWMHRMHHMLPLLWAVHVVHHQGEHFNLSLGIRNSWYSSLTNFPFVAILAVLGVPLEIFVVVSSIHYSVQFYNHNGLVGTSGILDKLMVTPSHHRVHHGTDALYVNRNFGGTLLWWDKLFCTFQPELEGVPMRYGVAGDQSGHNPLLASNAPFARWLGRRYPGLGRRPTVDWPERFIGIGGVALFGIVIYYVDVEGRFPPQQQALLFSLVFAGTIALGGLSDGRRWGAFTWTAIALSLPIVFVGMYQVRDAWALVFFALLFVHGIDGLRRLSRSKPLPHSSAEPEIGADA